MSLIRLPDACRVWGPDAIRLDMEEVAAEYLIDVLTNELRESGDVGARELRDALVRALSEDDQ